MKLFKFVCIGIILFSFASLPNTIIRIRENLINIIVDSAAGAEAYGEKNLAMIAKSSSQLNIIGILGGICGNIAIVFFMYYLTLKRKNTLILVALGVSSVIGPLGDIANGGRAIMAVFVINSTFLYLFIRRFLSSGVRHKVTRCFICIGILLLVPFVAVTLSRNKGDVDSALQMVENYTAQGFLQFNHYGLDAGGTRNGDYTAVAFKYLMGMDPAMYYSGRLSKYSHMKLDESMFYTFIGDFTLDYGPIGAFIIILLTALLFKKCLRTRNRSISFPQYLMLYLLMVGCLGYFQFPLGRESGNLIMIALLCLALVFKLSNDLEFHKRKSYGRKDFDCPCNI